MAKRDYYEVLGVARSAGEGELKSAFRKAAMKHHPDKNPGDASAEAKFKELNEAYQILSDPERRAAYDRMGHAAFEQGGGSPFGNDFGSSMSDIFEDFFGDILGGRRGGGRADRGADLRYNMEITLDDAFKGKVAEIRVPTSIVCEPCRGSGAKAGTSARTCPTCKGAGRVRATQGFFTLERGCPSCGGRGEVIEQACPNCGGAGRTSREKALSVNIPAGVEDGTRIRLTGEGEAGGRGGPAGDLYIFLSVKPHDFFRREGADIFSRIPIPFTVAALGGNFEVPTVDGGKTRVKVPEGTQSGKQFRIRGKGMPILRSKDMGDMYVQAVVETPTGLSKKQRDILEEFAKTERHDIDVMSEGFFAKAKAFWDGLGKDNS